MNNGDNDNRIRRYTFNDTAVKSNDTKPKTHIWPIIILIIVISALILGGVKTVAYFTSKNDTPTKTVNKKSDKSNEQSSQQEQKTRSKNTDSNNNNNDKSDIFAQRHIFSSVADAQNYAKATQDQWLKDGYQTYTVSADSQGYYILRFVK